MISLNDFIEVMYKNNNWFVVMLAVCVIYFISVSYRLRSELVRSKPSKIISSDRNDPYKQNIRV